MDRWLPLREYADRLTEHATHLASVAESPPSDAGYYECGYFLIYLTMRGWRQALGLAVGQTTSDVFYAEAVMLRHFVARRLQLEPAPRPVDDPQEQALNKLATDHAVASYTRLEWYDRFAWERPEPGPGDLLWEFSQQLARSTAVPVDAEKLRAATMAVAMILDPRTVVKAVAG